MKHRYPISLNDNLTGTIEIGIRVSMETARQAERLGIDADELTNIMLEKLNEVSEVVANFLGEDFVIEV